jgi:hypothetical protein
MVVVRHGVPAGPTVFHFWLEAILCAPLNGPKGCYGLGQFSPDAAT